MFAKQTTTTRRRRAIRRIPTTYMCQACGESFDTCNNTPDCNVCYSTGENNLIVLYLENDLERSEWLDLIDFSAG